MDGLFCTSLGQIADAVSILFPQSCMGFPYGPAGKAYVKDSITNKYRIGGAGSDLQNELLRLHFHRPIATRYNCELMRTNTGT